MRAVVNSNCQTTTVSICIYSSTSSNVLHRDLCHNNPGMHRQEKSQEQIIHRTLIHLGYRWLPMSNEQGRVVAVVGVYG